MKTKMNKVHKRPGTSRRALCGMDRGGHSKNKIPTSIEDRDVTCGLCLRIIAKGVKC